MSNPPPRRGLIKKLRGSPSLKQMGEYLNANYDYEELRYEEGNKFLGLSQIYDTICHSIDIYVDRYENGHMKTWDKTDGMKKQRALQNLAAFYPVLHRFESNWGFTRLCTIAVDTRLAAGRMNRKRQVDRERKARIKAGTARVQVIIGGEEGRLWRNHMAHRFQSERSATTSTPTQPSNTPESNETESPEDVPAAAESPSTISNEMTYDLAPNLDSTEVPNINSTEAPNTSQIYPVEPLEALNNEVIASTNPPNDAEPNQAIRTEQPAMSLDPIFDECKAKGCNNLANVPHKKIPNKYRAYCMAHCQGKGSTPNISMGVINGRARHPSVKEKANEAIRAQHQTDISNIQERREEREGNREKNRAIEQELEDLEVAA